MTAFILFFVMRLNGVEDAGLFSIASALAYQALTIGLFGVRNYQAADVRFRYSFKEYYVLRILTSALMYGVVVYYAFFQGYSPEKAAVIFSFSLFKSIDALEDVYQGEYQRKGRLDLGAYLQTIRYGISLAVLILLLFCVHDLSVCFLAASVVSLGIFYFQNRHLIKEFTNRKSKLRMDRLKDLLIATLPLCLATWLNIYILNASKYSIDKVLSPEMQAYYGTLVLPVFTINLLASVMYRPYISGLAEDWKSGNRDRFLKGCFQQLVVIVLLTAGISLFGWLIGLRLLSWLYGINLSSYMGPFLLLLFGGGLNTLAVFLTVVLTILDRQNVIFLGYVLSFLFCAAFSDSIVAASGLTGAGLVYAAASGILCIVYVGFLMHFLGKTKSALK